MCTIDFMLHKMGQKLQHTVDITGPSILTTIEEAIQGIEVEVGEVLSSQKTDFRS